jgi:phenylalanyl-tRNA synthetase beta subunit
LNYDPSWFANYIGADVAPDAQKKILEALGFEISGGKTWQIQPPSWRGDVEGKQDIAEEVIRIYGFEHIPSLSVHSESVGCRCSRNANAFPRPQGAECSGRARAG